MSNRTPRGSKRRSHGHESWPTRASTLGSWTSAWQALSAQAYWYVNAHLHVSKANFGDVIFIDMLRRQALSLLKPGSVLPEQAPVLKVRQLIRLARSVLPSPFF